MYQVSILSEGILVKRIFKYLLVTINLEVWYFINVEFKFVGYCYADFEVDVKVLVELVNFLVVN